MTREKLQADGNPYPDGYPLQRLESVAVELDRRLKVLEAELVQTRAERDAALKLVDDTLVAVAAEPPIARTDSLCTHTYGDHAYGHFGENTCEGLDRLVGKQSDWQSSRSSA
jgi:hypothetical protein